MDSQSTILGEPLAQSQLWFAERNPNSPAACSIDWMQIVGNDPIVSAQATCLTDDLTLNPPVISGTQTVFIVNGPGTMREYSLILVTIGTQSGAQYQSAVRVLTGYTS